MNARHTITAIALLCAPWSHAQQIADEPQEDLIQKAIQEFKLRYSGKMNEVTVDLTAPGASTADSAPDAEAEGEAPVLVTGKVPLDSHLVDEATMATPESDTEIPGETPPSAPKKGLAVRVEKLRTGEGHVDPATVKLLAPFPAKPLSQPQSGWRLDTSETAPPFTREVEISPGNKITLTVRPHLLVPDADGAASFSVSEPGFEAPLGYSQTATVSAILANSIRQLDDDSRELGNAIDQLQQILVSLPAPTPEPDTEPKSETKRK